MPLPPPEDAPAKMALGGQEGFRVNDADKYETVEEQSLVVMPGHLEVPLPNTELPEIVLSSIAAVVVGACLLHQQASHQHAACPDKDHAESQLSSHQSAPSWSWPGSRFHCQNCGTTSSSSSHAAQARHPLSLHARPVHIFSPCSATIPALPDASNPTPHP